MQADRASTQLPPAPRRRKRRDWGAVLAKILCVVFAVVGALPFAVGGVVRSRWAREWAVRETTRLLREHGIVARYDVALRLWPVSVELTRLEIDATDGGGPVLATPRISVRPRFFALLSGKLAIDQIELDSPAIRVVMAGGKVTNFDPKLPESGSRGGVFHAPFSVFSVADARVEVDIDGTRAKVDELDLDVTTDDDPELGTSYEIGVRAGEATMRRARVVHDNEGHETTAVDDDDLCAVDGRFRVEPGEILVRRLSARGSADLDAREGTHAGCQLPATDKRIVELALSHLRVVLPKGPEDGDLPKVDGHVRARIPVGIAERAVKLPKTDGWVGVDADVRYGADTVIPDLTGHFEAHDIQLDRYKFAQEIESDLTLRKNVIVSPSTTIRIAEGLVTMTNVSVEPLAKGVTFRSKLDMKGADFTALMSDLGVSDHAHVAWELRELHAPVISGTLVPLHLDGDFTAGSGPFEVDDKAHDDPAHQKILAFKESEFRAHVAIRPDALQFKSIFATVGKSVLENGFVSIGFHNDLKVDLPNGHIDLTDISPLAAIPLAGRAELEAHVSGVFSGPHLEADASVKDFVFGDIPFGTVTAAHASLTGIVVDLRGVKAVKGKSDYEMPTARLDFSKGGLIMDAELLATSLGVRDFLAIWKMDDDPRFTEIDGSIATRGTLHVALGGPEDVCGGGFYDVRATSHLTDVALFGEKFVDGDVGLEYRWRDRLAGIGGADIDVRGLTLHKAHGAGGAPLGAVIGSATIARGGEINGSVVLQAIPLSRIDSLGALRTQTEGAVTGMLQVDGTMDAYTVRGDVDLTPVRVRRGSFGGSHLRVVMSQRASPTKPLGKTRCGGVIGAPFDKDAYARDTSSQGEFIVDGDLLGGEVRLDKLTVTRQKAASVSGKVSLVKLDVGALVQAALPVREQTDDGAAAAPPPAPIGGQLSGDLAIDRLVVGDVAHASVKFAPSLLSLTRGGQHLSMRPATVPVRLENDTLTLPPFVLDLETPSGLKGACTVAGNISQVSGDPHLSVTADLAPVDLGVLVGIIPKLERSLGTLSGRLSMKGRLAAPEIAGELHVKSGEFTVHAWPSVVSEVDIDAVADAAELRVVHGAARFAGGTVGVTGSVPLRDLAFNRGQASVALRDIHVVPAEGIATTFDADLAVTLDTEAGSGPTASLPHVSGDVLVTSFAYTRPINLELNAFGVRAKRTDIETYDPSLDVVAFDGVRIRSRSPLKIRNNLVEVQLGIDSNALTVTGTDQRFGLRGELRAQPGGRFHLRANDFDVRQAIIRFDDPTRIAPNVDVLAVTEYRRYSDTSTGSAAGAGAGASIGSRGGIWRISLHAYGDADNLRLDMTSDPPLSQEDIVLLLTIGMTRAEIDQLQAGSLGASAALEALATVSGADKVVKTAIPVIDDFRFGSAYSTVTGRTEPQVIVGKRLTDTVRANVATTLAEDRELRSNIEWRLNRRISVQGSYDNINDVSSSAVGNVGVDFRWRLEFE